MSQLSLVKAEKGEVVSLTEVSPGVHLFRVGVGWNQSTDPTVAATFDIDLVAVLSDLDGKNAKAEEFFYFKNIDGKGTDGVAFYAGKSKEEIFTAAKALAESGIVAITKDNTTGEGDGDDETLFVNTANIPEGKKLTVAINVYQAAERGHRLGMISGSYLNVYDPGDATLITYDLNEDYSRQTGIIVGEFYNKNGADKFKAIGAGFDGDLEALLVKFQ